VKGVVVTYAILTWLPTTTAAPASSRSGKHPTPATPSNNADEAELGTAAGYRRDLGGPHFHLDHATRWRRLVGMRNDSPIDARVSAAALAPSANSTSL